MKVIEHVFVFRVGKPVRCMFDRDEDMKSTGTRHPFLAKYKVLYISVTGPFMTGFKPFFGMPQTFLVCSLFGVMQHLLPQDRLLS